MLGMDIPVESDVQRVIGLWTPNAGDRIRIVLRGASMRPILWLILDRDSSIYLAPRVIKPTLVKVGEKRGTGNSATIRYNEGERVDDPTGNPKLTIHGSGVLNAAGRRQFRQPLRGIKSATQLCSVLFQHPDTFAAISAVKGRDIVLDYPIDPRRPLCANLFAYPGTPSSTSEMSSVSEVNRASYQFDVLLSYPNLSAGAITLHLALYHGPEGPWPPANYIVYSAEPNAKNGE